MKRKRVYIAGPISKGSLANNVNQATAAFVALAKAGFAPLCPHWSVYSKPCHPDYDFDCRQNRVELPYRCTCNGTVEGNIEMTHADWMGVDLPWVEVSDAVLRLPGESTGAEIEVAHARASGIPVFMSVAEVVEHFAAEEQT